ncbi:Clp protease N-terminal domain-containing protein [Candidatus Solirubrobacter pratensis]|uniref:Clp protease N-terminal domain-containing protein n=1 Tax=Candidatus Solirubrobacter pratensis TaxID=1298857 RepID=UPI000404B827|nr:Clp protease N-terminal domain-containing protein [Candidatus Solirubrobacter pratensis]
MAAGQRITQLAAEAAAASTPLEALRRVTELRRELDTFERQQVARALAEGATFARIARGLGVSRQAAHRRFRELAAAELPLLTTPEARRVLRYAREEAAALGADPPRGEHIVLAVLRAADLPAAALLRSAGITLERARTQVEAATPRTPLFQRDAGTEDMHALLAAPAREARGRGRGRIEVEHLLLGTLIDETGGAARTLRALGADVDAIRRGLGALLESQPA